MATASVYFAIQAASGDQKHVFPADGISVPESRTFADGLFLLKQFTVSSTVITLFDAAASGPDMPDFDGLVIIASTDIWVSWAQATVVDGRDSSAVKVPANMPFILWVSTNGMTDNNDLAALSAATIDKVKAVRVTSDAVVQVFAFT